ncbi:class I SAM-dependent methyltransferase [Cellulomonas avistercoris]|nr:class I SAM-dependent methyltransferase [Cellulomonas avistercoris]
MLRDNGSSYADGAEAWLLDLFARATDLSSTSTELVEAAQEWAHRYHTDPARANVVRAMNVSSDAAVLEIGAGCGAVTRYLGETARLVDAVEPAVARARVARARTRDLDNVEVFVGTADDLPAERAYDLVVVTGVLEYVGGGTDDRQPYIDFLDAAARRLKPTGALVLAIENKLGVKYLAGAPEDHTGRHYDSVESYPGGTIARTFSRQELESLFVEVGLQPRTLVAFPDFKLCRTVFDVAQVDATCRRLAVQVPRFPSFDWYAPRARGVDEGLLWGSLFSAGLGADTGNSLVVVGTPPGAEDPWPSDTVMTYFSVGRRAPYLMAATVSSGDDGVTIRRRPLREGEDAGTSHRFVATDEPYHDLPTFLEEVGAGDDDRLRSLVAGWVALVDEARDEPVRLDLVPQNLLVDGERLVVVDQEWVSDGATWDQVVHRGLLRLALELADTTPPARWSGVADDVAGLVRHVSAGLDLDADWLEDAMDAEAAVLEEIAVVPYGNATDDARAWWRAALERELSTPLQDRRMGDGGGRQGDTQWRVESLTAELAWMTTQRDAVTTRMNELDEWIVGASERATEAARRETELRSALEVAADRIEGSTRQVVAEREHGGALAAELAARNGELEQLRGVLDEIEGSRAWRLVARYRTVKERVAGAGRPRRPAGNHDEVVR